MIDKPNGLDQKAEVHPLQQLPRVVAASELFKGSREILLELSGVRYRLRLTRRNKLILQK